MRVPLPSPAAWRRAALTFTAALACAAPPAAHAAHAGAWTSVWPTTSRVSPPPSARFDYQLGGAYQPATSVKVVTRDRTAAPAPGRYNICYVNGFQTQESELSWWRTKHPDLLLRAGGREVRDPGWPEVLLDTATPAKRLKVAGIVGAWIDRCAKDGFQGVEIDNLDSWTRSKRQLNAQDNLALAGLFISRAHQAGLAIGQKNAAEVSQRGRALGFDFAVAEECAVYNECGAYTRWYGRHLLEIEYTDESARAFPDACRVAAGRWPVIERDRDLVPAGSHGYAYRGC